MAIRRREGAYKKGGGRKVPLGQEVRPLVDSPTPIKEPTWGWETLGRGVVSLGQGISDYARADDDAYTKSAANYIKSDAVRNRELYLKGKRTLGGVVKDQAFVKEFGRQFDLTDAQASKALKNALKKRIEGLDLRGMAKVETEKNAKLKFNEVMGKDTLELSDLEIDAPYIEKYYSEDEQKAFQKQYAMQVLEGRIDKERVRSLGKRQTFNIPFALNWVNHAYTEGKITKEQQISLTNKAYSAMKTSTERKNQINDAWGKLEDDSGVEAHTYGRQKREDIKQIKGDIDHVNFLITKGTFTVSDGIRRVKQSIRATTLDPQRVNLSQVDFANELNKLKALQEAGVKAVLADVIDPRTGKSTLLQTDQIFTQSQTRFAEYFVAANIRQKARQDKGSRFSSYEAAAEDARASHGQLLAEVIPHINTISDAKIKGGWSPETLAKVSLMDAPKRQEAIKREYTRVKGMKGDEALAYRKALQELGSIEELVPLEKKPGWVERLKLWFGGKVGPK